MTLRRGGGKSRRLNGFSRDVAGIVLIGDVPPPLLLLQPSRRHFTLYAPRKTDARPSDK